MQTRRAFIHRVARATAAGVVLNQAPCLAQTSPKSTTIRKLPRPVAIAMWDFSWLLRQHPDGGFEDWERAVAELVERGYDAIRLDVFPHLVGRAGRTAAPDCVTFKGRADKSRSLWGNDVDVTVNAREALLKFIPICQKYHVSLDLSTWFQGPPGTVDKITSFEQFVGLWEETIQFLEQNRLMENILFIDLLNEYPLWNGFTWLRSSAQTAAKRAQAEKPVAGQEHLQQDRRGPFSQPERDFYSHFSTRLLRHFRRWRPQYDFCLSLTSNVDDFRPEASVDLASMDVLDVHIWFGVIPEYRKYEMGNARRQPAEAVQQRYAELRRLWTDKRTELVAWMDEKMKTYVRWGRENNLVLGNTEGWGCVGWDDIPALDWRFIKEAAEVCVGLARRYRYKFICTSNFTHPHFHRLWADVGWHKAITDLIKS